MLFWGLGALSVGMSYQGLGYELKCAPYDICIFTSWFELCYLYSTAVSISALAIVIAKTVLIEGKQKFLKLYEKFENLK
ncbi:MAG: hypothetical protein KAU02_01435 [Tenericutes bacterium]|nr:hypothetical protein [Mycoplasmatota bacterium]